MDTVTWKVSTTTIVSDNVVAYVGLAATRRDAEGKRIGGPWGRLSLQ